MNEQHDTSQDQPVIGYLRPVSAVEWVEDRQWTWALRFAAVFVLLRTLPNLLYTVRHAWEQLGFGWSIQDILWHAAPAAVVVACVGMILRQRWAAGVAVFLIAAAPLRGHLLFASHEPGEYARLALDLAEYLPLAAILAYLLWHADRAGTLLPRRENLVPRRDGVQLLVRCAGAYLAVYGGIALVHLAAWPLLPLIGLGVEALGTSALINVGVMLAIAATGVAILLGQWNLLLLVPPLLAGRSLATVHSMSEYTGDPVTTTQYLWAGMMLLPSIVMSLVLFAKARGTLGSAAAR